MSVRKVNVLVAGMIAACLCVMSAWAEEVPMLSEKVAAGELPPVSERLPENPLVVDFAAEGKELGKYGGDLNLLMGRTKDIGQIPVYTYARLVGYDRNFDLYADILESFEVSEGREFTFKLRKGHKWSDGHPFTTEDFRYFWEDMVKDEELGRKGVPNQMLVDGAEPVVSIIDELTIKYTWPEPNPAFLNALAGPSPLYIYRPAHYMKQFHAKYGDREQLDKNAQDAGAKDWTGMHTRMQRQNRPENPDLPTLQSFTNTTASPAQRYVFVRNPFFHRVDPEGRQLPYIDRILMDVVTKDVIAAKSGSGDTDLQARYIRFDDFAFLKEGESRNDYSTRLWFTGKGSEYALFPNLNTNDPVWRGLMRDVRFRRALSLGIDRDEINEVIYFGLATPSANTVISQSPLFKEKYRTAWSTLDVDQANALLDEVGLGARDDEGFRLLPSGERAEITIESAGESTEETDVLELIVDHWKAIGIKAFVRASQRDIFRRRALTGDTLISSFFGMNNGLASAGMTPEELAPTSEAQLQWPMWGQYFQTSGKTGEPAEAGIVADQLELYNQWKTASSTDEQREIWHKMLDTYTDQVFSIGTVNSSRQPVVVNNKLKNIPEEGIYTWEPASFFGVYKPDTFWFEQ